MVLWVTTSLGMDHIPQKKGGQDIFLTNLVQFGRILDAQSQRFQSGTLKLLHTSENPNPSRAPSLPVIPAQVKGLLGRFSGSSHTSSRLVFGSLGSRILDFFRFQSHPQKRILLINPFLGLSWILRVDFRDFYFRGNKPRHLLL